MDPSQLRARYRRIVTFFARITLAFIFWEIVLPRIGLRRLSDRTRSRRLRTIAANFRALAVRMGGLMIKVGQFLSARLDVLPAEITDELSDLQDEVPAEEFATVRRLAEDELCCTLEDHFASVEEIPLAAASLGQVHRAQLFEADAANMGFTDVVIKVQRPHIEQIVEVDLAALRRFGGWLQHYRPVRERADVPALIDEFATTTAREIDYLAEGSHAETFGANFADDPRVRVPAVVWDLTTRRVLTLEDVSAIKITDYDAIDAAGIDRGEIATVLLGTYLQQIFEDGFFHADPHPGNIFVQPLETLREDGSRAWLLTFVDFGMVGFVPDGVKTGLREGLIAVGTRDGERLVQGLRTLDVLLPGADLDLIERASIQFFDRFWGMDMSELRDIDHAEIMRFGLQFRELIFDLPFQIPEDLLLLGRTVAILSGMCTGLDPDFNVWTNLAPYATKLVSEDGGSQWQTWLDEAGKILQVLIGLPKRIDRTLTTIERGELSVQTPLLEFRVRRLDRSVNRLAGAIVFAGTLIAGAVLYGSDPTFAKWIMAASLVPLAWILFAGRGHGGPRG